MVWPVVELGELMARVDRRERVEPDRTYSLLGMRSQIGGPFLRETKSGASISAERLNRAAAEDFVYSRLFAWQGAFGVIASKLDGCYVSNEFPLYTVDTERLDARFLTLWFGLPSTQRKVEMDCHGSTPGTRNRFKEAFFEKMLTPLPPLCEQRRIVTRLDHIAGLIEKRRIALAGARRNTMTLLSRAFDQVIEGAEYRPMAKVAPLVRRRVDVHPEEKYRELGIRSFGRGTFHKPALEGALVGSKKLYRIVPWDLLFNNIFAWEGAVAVARDEDEGRVGSHRFLTCVPDPQVARVEFLRHYFLSSEGLRALGEASPGGAGRNRTLGLKRLAAINVPVPAIEKQRWFEQLQAKVQHLDRAHAQIDDELGTLIPAILRETFAG